MATLATAEFMVVECMLGEGWRHGGVDSHLQSKEVIVVCIVK